MKPFGNYCGPWWSAGKVQRSVVSDVPAVDELDELCRAHDASYANNEDLLAADKLFAESAMRLGGWGTVMGAIVGTQALLRPLDYSEDKMSKTSNKQHLRGGSSGSGLRAPQATAKQLRNDTVSAAPVAFATRRTGAAPRMVTKPDGTVEISHRTFLQPVDNELDFSTVGFPCNPGMSGSFPWLSKIARRYEEYRFKRLRYEFRSVASSATPGVVMMSFDYDAADAAPATKSEQAQTIPNSECNVWMNNDLSVPTSSQFRYVRAGTLAANLDVKTYDMGNLWLSTSYGNNVVGGELYVEYTVELRKPTAGIDVGGEISTSTAAATSPFGITASASSTRGVAFPFSRVDNTTLKVIAGGEYLMTYIVQGNGTFTAASVLPALSTTGTTSTVQLLYTALSAATIIQILRIRCETGDSMVFGAAATGSGLLSTKLQVAAIDYATVTNTL